MYNTALKEQLWLHIYVWGTTAGHNRIPSSEGGIPNGDFQWAFCIQSSALTSRATVPRLYITSYLVSSVAMPGVECAQIELVLHA